MAATFLRKLLFVLLMVLLFQSGVMLRRLNDLKREKALHQLRAYENSRELFQWPPVPESKDNGNDFTVLPVIILTRAIPRFSPLHLEGLCENSDPLRIWLQVFVGRGLDVSSDDCLNVMSGIPACQKTLKKQKSEKSILWLSCVVHQAPIEDADKFAHSQLFWHSFKYIIQHKKKFVDPDRKTYIFLTSPTHVLVSDTSLLTMIHQMNEKNFGTVSCLAVQRRHRSFQHRDSHEQFDSVEDVGSIERYFKRLRNVTSDFCNRGDTDAWCEIVDSGFHRIEGVEAVGTFALQHPDSIDQFFSSPKNVPWHFKDMTSKVSENIQKLQRRTYLVRNGFRQRFVHQNMKPFYLVSAISPHCALISFRSLEEELKIPTMHALMPESQNCSSVLGATTKFPIVEPFPVEFNVIIDAFQVAVFRLRHYIDDLSVKDYERVKHDKIMLEAASVLSRTRSAWWHIHHSNLDERKKARLPSSRLEELEINLDNFQERKSRLQLLQDDVDDILKNRFSVEPKLPHLKLISAYTSFLNQTVNFAAKHVWCIAHNPTSTFIDQPGLEVLGWTLSSWFRQSKQPKRVAVAAHSVVAFDEKQAPANFFSRSTAKLPPAYPIPEALTLFEREADENQVVIFWQGPCCQCCGFSEEIQHFVDPLRRTLWGSRTPIWTTLDQNCFCPGANNLETQCGYMPTHQLAMMPPGIKPFATVNVNNMLFTHSNYAKKFAVIWISHNTPHQYGDAAFMARPPDFHIGRSMFEYSKLPSGWTELLNQPRLYDPKLQKNQSGDGSGFAARAVDEIWVPSTWVRNMFIDNGVNPNKTFVMPEAIDTDMFSPVTWRTQRQRKIRDPTGRRLWPSPLRKWLDNRDVHWCSCEAGFQFAQKVRNATDKTGRPFTFISHSKWEQRKGWDLLIRAFLLAFSKKSNEMVAKDATTNVEDFGGFLHILTSPFEENNAGLRVEISAASIIREVKAIFDQFLRESTDSRRLPPLCVTAGSDIPTTLLSAWYAEGDAFVLLSRGEGWGRPFAQAMATGLPTIGPAHGGSLDFMTPENSFLVDLDGLDEVPNAEPGTKWATPSVAHAAFVMQEVAMTPFWARDVGQLGRNHIVSKFSTQAVAKQLIARFQQLQSDLD